MKFFIVFILLNCAFSGFSFAGNQDHPIAKKSMIYYHAGKNGEESGTGFQMV